MVWQAAIPFLRRNARLADGLETRLVKALPQPADLWIQASSAGEAHLADNIIATLNPAMPLKVLLTTNTRQGLDILRKVAAKAKEDRPNLTVRSDFFPFDRPRLMRRAVRAVRPRLMVLLETELWPGLLRELKSIQTPIMIVNGRLTPKSVRGYRRFKRFWQELKPDKILTVSELDAHRYASVFTTSVVSVMPNIKFDRIDFTSRSNLSAHPLSMVLSDHHLVVLGSIRREEEQDVLMVIRKLLTRNPKVTIGLSPRHLPRIPNWRRMLSEAGIPWRLRSTLAKTVAPGTVIVWDIFGELNLAYSLCRSAFVGGSLAPLGGQNFLEPLAFGIRPVIGPHWNNFAWVGRAIVKSDLVQQAHNRQEVVDRIAEQIRKPDDRASIRARALEYVQARQGGTGLACRAIETYF